MGVKALLAILINAILIPIVVDTSLKNNLYGTGGLADDAFFSGLTNSFIAPALKVFNVSYYIQQKMKDFYNTPWKNLYKTQK